jgi:hypothetical protein
MKEVLSGNQRYGKQSKTIEGNGAGSMAQKAQLQPWAK